MKVVELKEELGERGEALSGNKAWLRRRLHAAIASEDLETALRAPPESRMIPSDYGVERGVRFSDLVDGLNESLRPTDVGPR
ncbi:hypothetical protein EMIHUDRAFT_194849 [Emiliania huxleyi CCMP1516]|uniref:SAP domain-containing protein n=2 Tax=Emiliania huxleyi TaxID=2903 RepID=A0A0D3L289_EMIH1|nr:hypothetical protein EMIHUDRAFT_194849 [Emiliania huxleyi CCMP1516]EOD42124.1 hypothetical protein EMIHUDRAFT_194849 [Emiliania huxleyi CCMP1516]|eukprot:XP_005794553.1 hypothetical protein EMIHUDRAFT_194849 [Emiliania huxleyi CCMP1516]